MSQNPPKQQITHEIEEPIADFDTQAWAKDAIDRLHHFEQAMAAVVENLASVRAILREQAEVENSPEAES